MKFTQFRKDKKGALHVSTRTVEQVINRMTDTRKPAAYEVCPNMEMRRNAEGSPQPRHLNGVVILTFGGLHEAAQREAVKESAMTLPPSLAAFSGSDGQSVKVLVRFAIGSKDFELADTLAVSAYEDAVILYSRVTGLDVCREEPSARMSFTMPHDGHPLLNVEAIPLDRDASGTETMRLINLLTARYRFRYNTVMGYPEYHSRRAVTDGWQPVDDRVVNGLTMEARLSGLDAWDKDIKRYVQSNMVKPFNPILDFLGRAEAAWDGHTDHIGLLARTVPCEVPQWEDWFRKWLLYMVAQWLGKTRQYGNSVAPLLISEQGNNKSTFCRRLLPDCLQWGYNDNLLISEKKATLQAMSQFLLINLDEFNQISPQIQEGFLKNVIQLARVKVKRPYGKHVEDFPRLASFIATTNEHSVLADASGNRRFIGIELTGAIDVSQPIDYEGLYGQAVTLINQGERYWFNDQEVREIMAHNCQFQVKSPAEQYFHESFRIPEADEEGEWMTAVAIYDHLRRKAGAGLRVNGLRAFGQVLSNMPGLLRRRVAVGTQYQVIRNI